MGKSVSSKCFESSNSVFRWDVLQIIAVASGLLLATGEMTCGYILLERLYWVSDGWAFPGYLTQWMESDYYCFCLRPKNSQQPDTTKIPLLKKRWIWCMYKDMRVRIHPSSFFYNIPLGQLLSRQRRDMSTLFSGFWCAALLQLRPVEILRLFLIIQASYDASKHSPGGAFGYSRGANTWFGIDVYYFFFSFGGEGRI